MKITRYGWMGAASAGISLSVQQPLHLSIIEFWGLTLSLLAFGLSIIKKE